MGKNINHECVDSNSNIPIIECADGFCADQNYNTYFCSQYDEI
jgi:hypothetical protein